MHKRIHFKLLLEKALLLLFIIIFVTIYASIFGSENTLAGVAVITSILMFQYVDVAMPFKEALWTIPISWILIACVTHWSHYSLYFLIPLNFISIFALIYIYTHKVETKAYLPFILCYVFMEGNPVSNEAFIRRFLALTISGLMVAASYYISHRKKEDKQYPSYKQLATTFSPSSLRFNFALRLALGLSIAMFIGFLFGFTKSMWISISVMSLTQPYQEDTRLRIKHRVMSTIIGAALFILLFEYIVPEQYSSLVLLLLSYLYMFVNDYWIQIIFITLNSLGAAMVLLDTSTAAYTRVLFVICGAIIAFIINYIWNPHTNMKPPI